MPVQTSPETSAQTSPKEAGFREQAILTVKVLLISGGALGILTLLDWMVAP